MYLYHQMVSIVINYLADFHSALDVKRLVLLNARNLYDYKYKACTE